jgi:hypothetical protein
MHLLPLELISPARSWLTTCFLFRPFCHMDVNQAVYFFVHGEFEAQQPLLGKTCRMGSQPLEEFHNQPIFRRYPLFSNAHQVFSPLETQKIYGWLSLRTRLVNQASRNKRRRTAPLLQSIIAGRAHIPCQAVSAKFSCRCTHKAPPNTRKSSLAGLLDDGDQ